MSMDIAKFVWSGLPYKILIFSFENFQVIINLNKIMFTDTCNLKSIKSPGKNEVYKYLNLHIVKNEFQKLTS